MGERVIQPVDDAALWDESDPLLASEPPTARPWERTRNSPNGNSKPAVAPPNGQERDLDRFMLENPDEAEKMLRGYHLMRGAGSEVERDDIRFGTIPVSRNLDARRYGLGLAGVTVHMGAIRAGELVVVGAREGHGKTAFAEMVATTNARDHKVLFCTLEMTREEIRDRMLARKLRLSIDALHGEQHLQSDRYRDAHSLLSSFDLLIWSPENRERNIQAITKRAVDTTAAILVIDYTRRIDGWQPGRTAGETMDYLSAFVRRSHITVVLLAQLNRDAAGRRPNNANFQDTGKLEQAADRCILLHRPYLGEPGKDDVVELTISKNRSGPCFKAHAFWHGETMSFGSMNEADEAALTCCKKRKKGDDD